jgi:quinol monooxygenase YgiN
MIFIHIIYRGENGSAKKFVEEMMNSGIVSQIRKENGNLSYNYYQSLDDAEEVLLIDCWENQESLDLHHVSPMMATIAMLREKYHLHMLVKKYESQELSIGQDSKYIRK